MVIITGVSGGIGAALVEQYLHDGEQVIGIGRRNSTEHPSYRFVKTDLSDPEAIRKLTFDFSTATSVTLINNAGVIGSIQRVSEQKESDAEEVLMVNTIAPMMLTQQFLTQVPFDLPLTIVNISSGAALRPIPAWSAYCASKAAINLFSQTVYLEEQERGRPVKVYAVAPGVVDTAMQESIRAADPSTFSSHETFIELKASDQLLSPVVVARRLKRLLSSPYDGSVVYSLRDVRE